MVTDIVWEAENADIQRIFLGLEKHSEHPLATAVVQALSQANADNGGDCLLTGFESITGKGVKASWNGKTYYAGNRRMLAEKGITISPVLSEKAEAFAQEAKTVIWFADEQQALATCAIADRIKETSKKAIAELQQRGISVVMLTGDNEQTARRIAAEAGIAEFRAEVLPQQNRSISNSFRRKESM